MDFETAVQEITPGRYRHFKGNEYEVLYIARYSETTEPMVVYRALYGDGGVWVRPADMLPEHPEERSGGHFCRWNEAVERDGKTYQRFTRIDP